MAVAPLLTERLRLDPFDPAAIERLLADDRAGAGRALSVEVTEAFAAGLDPHFLQVQLRRMRANPEGRRWCARVIIERDSGRLAGHCGFHGPPEDVGRAEIGYTVLEEFRNRGFATEAAQALLEFARDNGVRRVFATAVPTNAVSLRVIANLGFIETGTQVDEIDGLELVFERDV